MITAFLIGSFGAVSILALRITLLPYRWPAISEKMLTTSFSIVTFIVFIIGGVLAVIVYKLFW